MMIGGSGSSPVFNDGLKITAHYMYDAVCQVTDSNVDHIIN